MKQLVIAFMVAPLMALPAYTAWFGLIEPKGFGMAVGKMFAMGVYVLPVSYAATLLLGLPAYLMLRLLGWANPVAVTIIGFPLGLLVVAFLDDISHRGNIGLAAMCGMGVSGIAAFIVSREEA